MAAHITRDGVAVDASSPAAAIRVRTIREVGFLRALAWRAARDGLPKSELRAANARAAARSLLRHARQIDVICSAR